MTLEAFVRNFVGKNSLIRLWYKNPKEYGHIMLIEDNKSVCMEHELLKQKVWQSKYLYNRVEYVKDIYVDDFYREAINIIIEL